MLDRERLLLVVVAPRGDVKLVVALIKPHPDPILTRGIEKAELQPIAQIEVTAILEPPGGSRRGSRGRGGGRRREGRTALRENLGPAGRHQERKQPQDEGGADFHGDTAS